MFCWADNLIMATTITSSNFYVPHATIRPAQAQTVESTKSAQDTFAAGSTGSLGLSDHFEKVLKKVETQATSLLGDEQAMQEALAELGPKPDFEDLVAYVMMKMVRAEELKSAELLQKIENGGHPGLKGFVANRAADFAGLAGAAAGGVLGSLGGAAGAAAGAAVGQDIAKRAVNSATGYASEDSKEMQMQKLTMVMQKKDRMMALFTNAVRSSHESVMRVIGNLRA